MTGKSLDSYLKAFGYIFEQEPSIRKRFDLDPSLWCSHGYFKGFAFQIDKRFADALDIKRTVLKDRDSGYEFEACTGGFLFSFKQHDVLYDTIEAHNAWDEAIDKIRCCIEIQTARPANINEDGTYNPGAVNIKLIKFKRIRRRIHPEKPIAKIEKLDEFSVSQLDLVRFIITGKIMTKDKKILWAL